jgi:glycosyltransferase involved in cell wall biosynthesis
MARAVARDRIVSVQTTSERGGAEYANADLLEALRQRGHAVLLVTNVPDIAAKTQVPVQAIDLGPKLNRRSVVQTALAAPRTLWRLARALRAARPVGVTFLHFKKEQLLCALLPPQLTGRIAWAEWGPVPPSMRRGLPRLLYALAARRARTIMAVSEGTKRTVVGAGVPAEKVVVVPNLVDVDEVSFDPEARERLRGEWGAGPDTLVAGCISRFQRRKRNDVVIDAMGQLDGDVLLVMAGEGEEEAALRERAAPHGERVRFAPNVRGHVEAFLSACDVLVFAPSPTEGAPRVIVMAQLVGVPVIATDPEGADELLPPGTGMICSPSHDPSSLAEALAVYRDDPERRRREGVAGRAATLARHDPERTLQAVERALGLRGEAASGAA